MTDNSPNNFLELEEKIVEVSVLSMTPKFPSMCMIRLIYDTDINHDTGVVDITMTSNYP